MALHARRPDPLAVAAGNSPHPATPPHPPLPSPRFRASNNNNNMTPPTPMQPFGLSASGHGANAPSSNAYASSSSSTSPRRAGHDTAATSSGSKSRARLNPFEYEDERRRSWLHQDMPERLVESGWTSRPPPELQRLHSGGMGGVNGLGAPLPGSASTSPVAQSTTTSRHTAGLNGVKEIGDVSVAGSGGAGGPRAPAITRHVSNGKAKDTAPQPLQQSSMGNHLTGYPTTSLSEPSPLLGVPPHGLADGLYPSYAFGGPGATAAFDASPYPPPRGGSSMGTPSLSSGPSAIRRRDDLSSSQHSHRAHPYAGIADMEARVAGMFPNNPRPFGVTSTRMPDDQMPWGIGLDNKPGIKFEDTLGGFGSASSSPAGGFGGVRSGMGGGANGINSATTSANNSPQLYPTGGGGGGIKLEQSQQQQQQGRSGRAGNRRKQKFTRTRTGCLTCRARRIKCDEGLPVCKRCIIAKKECQWSPDDQPKGDADASRSATPNSQDDGGHRIFSRASSHQHDEPAGTRAAVATAPATGVAATTNPSSTFSFNLAQDAAADLLLSGGLVNPTDINFDESFVAGYPAGVDANSTGTGSGVEDSIFSGTGMAKPNQHLSATESVEELFGGRTRDSSMIGGSDNSYPSSDSAGVGGSNGSHRAQTQDGSQDSRNHLMAVSSDLAGKHQSWGQPGQQQAGAPMLTTPNFLLPWFPTAEERSLILHYCANAADLMMAIPSGLNPMLAINLPLALDSPRGVNTSADALRVTLLGIAAVHQAFLLARSGVSTAQTAAMFQYASNLRNTGKDLVRRAAMQPDGSGARSDAALGAGTALATIDIFFGGSGWADNFRLAKEMIAFRGGPAEMLKASNPTLLQDGVSVSAARLVLEILTIYETFGSLTTGEEPTLISEKWGDWWFKTGQTTYEEHSVEKQFGMSRVMVHLFNRLTRLLSRVQRSPQTIITESDAHILPSLNGTTTGSSGANRPNSLGIKLDGGADSPTRGSNATAHAGGADPLVLEARKLNDDVDAWIESLQLATLEHERVQVGNRAYAHTMKILLLRNVFKYSRDDIRVQNAAMEVIRHCSHSTALLGMSIDLTWPAIIAGCCVDGESRTWLLTLLEGFKAQCCFDIETAGRIIGEVWRRSDVGEPRADWKDVCDDLGLQVLLC